MIFLYPYYNNKEKQEVGIIMKHIQNILSGLLAGIMISLGAFVNVFMISKSGTMGMLETIVGAFMFSLGLLFICSFSLCLYTGRIAYLLDHGFRYCAELAESLLGNVLGCLLMGYMTRGLRVYEQVKPTFQQICETRLGDQWYSLLLLAILCGFFVYLAVEIFKSKQPPVIRVIGLILSVSAFVLLGCEHVIADIYYFIAAGKLTFKAFGILCLIFIGNSIGSLFFHGVKKIVTKSKRDE